MAETEKTVIVIPVILEVAKVELPVTVRIPIHVRHPVVTVVVSGIVRYAFLSHREQLQSFSVFYSEFRYSLAYRTDLFDFS